ncbi:Uncharacterised protein [Mycobacteroides abscessus subsp. abscessus]|nr:Uncharacterised protein [Mycobacteroides abscessus subsp. abscessus]
MPASASSTGVDGARKSTPEYSGGGSPCLSSLPFTVTGNVCSATTATGTM